MLLRSKGFMSSGDRAVRPEHHSCGRGGGGGGSWAWEPGLVLIGLFSCSGSHGQFKRPERSFTLETEEPTGTLSPFAPGESDQCPRQGPCRLQPGYDQPGLFQGKELGCDGGEGGICGQTNPPHTPTPSTKLQTQGVQQGQGA